MPLGDSLFILPHVASLVKNFFQTFFGKRLDKPVEMVYTKVTLIKNETLVSYYRPNQAFLPLSKAQPAAKVKTYSPKNDKEVSL